MCLNNLQIKNRFKDPHGKKKYIMIKSINPAPCQTKNKKHKLENSEQDFNFPTEL